MVLTVVPDLNKIVGGARHDIQEVDPSEAHYLEKGVGLRHVSYTGPDLLIQLANAICSVRLTKWEESSMAPRTRMMLLARLTWFL